MMKIIISSSLVATIAVFSLAIALSVATTAQPAYAEETPVTVMERKEAAQAAAAEKKEAAQAAAAEKKEAAQTRLEEKKLKACQNREKTITNIMSRMGDRGQKHIDLFSKTAEKTQAFYTKKGKLLSNYDALVAELAVKKAAAQTAVDVTKSSVVEFKCDGSDPKGAAASFKERMKAQNEALKAYKTAVKDLIVGVKSVQGPRTSTEKSTGGEQ